MTEERNTVYIPTWMDSSIPGLRNPYAGREICVIDNPHTYEYREIVWGAAEKKKAAKMFHEWLGSGKSWE